MQETIPTTRRSTFIVLLVWLASSVNLGMNLNKGRFHRKVHVVKRDHQSYGYAPQAIDLRWQAGKIWRSLQGVISFDIN
jgi:hypothetical protein